MAESIPEFLSFAAAVVVAALVAFAGLDMTLRGDTTWGLALLGASALIILFEKYVTTPGDATGLAASKALGLVAKEPEDDDEEPAESP